MYVERDKIKKKINKVEKEEKRGKLENFSSVNCLRMAGTELLPDKEICAVCQAPAQQKCSACKIIFYCCREHQKHHWKEHARKCKAFEVKKKT